MHYSTREVLEIARQIERNGARFYEKAADLCQRPAHRTLLLDLAAMERNHERTFAGMAARGKEAEGQEPVYDPDGDVGRYLQAAAGGQVFDLRADPAEWLTRERTMEQIVTRAIGLEKDSIVFYLGVRETLPASLGRGWVDAIISQEMGHVAQLTGMLTQSG